MFPNLMFLGDLWKKKEAAKPGMAGPKPSVSPEAAMALTLWLADAVGLKLGVAEISEVLFRLGEEKGYEPPYLAMRRIPGGVFSEDAAQWIGELTASAYVIGGLGSDPVRLLENGVRICRIVLEDERRLNKEQQDLLSLAHAILELLLKYQPR